MGPGDGNTATHHIVEEGSRGGILAAGKMQKWVIKKRVNTCVKFVTVAWVLDSMKNGKGLPEARYPPHHGGAKLAGQQRIMHMFQRSGSGLWMMQACSSIHIIQY